jgi:hypothetical protein
MEKRRARFDAGGHRLFMAEQDQGEIFLDAPDAKVNGGIEISED